MRLLADIRLTEPDSPEDSNSMVLLAAAWLTGEYCSLLEAPEDALGLLSQKSTAKLDPAIQATYLQSILKIFAYWMNSLQYSWTEEVRQSLLEMVDLLREGVKEMYGRSPDLEVQERVRISMKSLAEGQVAMQYFAWQKLTFLSCCRCDRHPMFRSFWTSLQSMRQRHH